MLKNQKNDADREFQQIIIEDFYFISSGGRKFDN